MARSQDAHIRVQGVQPVQVLAGLIGLIYLALGIFGLVRTGFAGFLVNPLQNVMHIVIGVLGLLAASSSGLSRTFGWLLFVGLGLVSIWGLMLMGVISSNPVSGLGNALNLNAADNWLHIVTALVGLYIAIMPARKGVHMAEPATADADTTTMEVPEHRSGLFHRGGQTPAH